MKNSFGIPLIPENDELRVQKIKEYDILDTRQEGPFDYLAALAVHLFNVPIALISLVDRACRKYPAATVSAHWRS
jgi:hypothetical protein